MIIVLPRLATMVILLVLVPNHTALTITSRIMLNKGGDNRQLSLVSDVTRMLSLFSDGILLNTKITIKLGITF